LVHSRAVRKIDSLTSLRFVFRAELLEGIAGVVVIVGGSSVFSPYIVYPTRTIKPTSARGRSSRTLFTGSRERRGRLAVLLSWTRWRTARPWWTRRSADYWSIDNWTRRSADNWSIGGFTRALSRSRRELTGWSIVLLSWTPNGTARPWRTRQSAGYRRIGGFATSRWSVICGWVPETSRERKGNSKAFAPEPCSLILILEMFTNTRMKESTLFCFFLLFSR
jgi:hypothetical protein